jgi:hypothetical protein
MTNSLPQKTHAETLIKVTEEYTLRPKTGDRARVCIATLQYLLDNFAYDLEPGDDWDSGISGQYVDTMDIHHLIYQLQKLK